MTQWTETAIVESLGDAVYRMVWSNCGRCDVVNLTTIDQSAANQKVNWTEQDLVNLALYKRRGHTMDEIEVLLDRDRKSIQTKWTKREEWIGTITVPDDPPVAPQISKEVTHKAIMSLDDAFVGPIPEPRLHEIANAVCKVYGIWRNDLVSSRRNKKFCDARHVYFWIARKFTQLSFPVIGRRCGNRDHTTVMHGFDKVEKNLPQYSDRIVSVLQELGILFEVSA
jgi:hypothetical protein